MIRELKQKGWTITAIAKETGFDRKTIRKYLNSETAPQSGQRMKKGSILDPYKPYILERIKEGTTNCAVLLEEIQKLGYEGKSTILYDLIEKRQRNRQPFDLKRSQDDKRKSIGLKA